MSEHLKEDFISFCKKFDQAMLVTHGSEGLVARPMAIAEIDSQGNFWFVTDKHSAKVDEIENDSQTCVTMSSSSGSASVKGRATLVEDKTKVHSLWQETWKVWFPDGPDDPRIVLIKILADEGAYWSSSGSAGLKYLFAAAKAYLKGERPQTDEDMHGRVNLHTK